MDHIWCFRLSVAGHFLWLFQQTLVRECVKAGPRALASLYPAHGEDLSL